MITRHGSDPRQSSAPHPLHMPGKRFGKQYGRKAVERLGRYSLKGQLGDALHTVLFGAGHAIRLLLRKLRLLFIQILMQLMAFTKTDRQGLAST